jgi:hypothetical protein
MFINSSRYSYPLHLLPDSGNEILKHLLELNHQIHVKELKAGLWDKKSTKSKEYKTKAANTSSVEEEGGGYGDLFENTI